MDMISLHDIQKSYGSHQVLKNVDLTIRQGEIYGLIENGAGKTTIFKIILGLTDFENGHFTSEGKMARLPTRCQPQPGCSRRQCVTLLFQGKGQSADKTGYHLQPEKVFVTAVLFSV